MRVLLVMTIGAALWGCLQVQGAVEVGLVVSMSPEVEYASAVALAGVGRLSLAKQFEEAVSADEKIEVIAVARRFAAGMVISLARHWYGTPWAFHGYSTTPGKGDIACGYFVTTVLQHAGFKVQRSKLARQPASLIIRTLVRRRALINVFSGIPAASFAAAMEVKDEGIYIVGLDTHVGFIFKTASGTRFVHANYFDPPLAVDDQSLTETSPLTTSISPGTVLFC